MKLIAHWVLLASCLLLLGGVDRAWAEGNCPPGYYPIGGQGARGCAPIPGGATGSTGSSEIRLATPTGKWTKTWGGNCGVEKYSGCWGFNGVAIQE